tara:strand:+ start:233 stop:862 length:630 start_codon:yes stop_codon:yes gene_type:complete
MNNVLKIFFLVLFITLTSCASKVEINPVVNVSTPSGLKKIKGKYAGYVQTGGWQLESKADGWNCSAWTFDVDVNQVFSNGMTQLLNNSFEDIKIYSKVLSKEELKNGNYIAQVSILQSNATASFIATPGFFTNKIESKVFLNTIVSALGNSGLQFQNNVDSNGIGMNSSWGCDAAEGTQIAVDQAVSKITEIGALYIREGVRSVQDNSN